MAGLAKGLAILELFGPRTGRITAAEAARATGVTRAAARRCLLTLAALEFVEHDGRYFTPAPRLLGLGTACQQGDALAAAAGPILDRLRDEIGESVSLAVQEGDEALFIARSAAKRLVSAAVTLGARWPLYCTAVGRVLLLARSPAQIDRYLQNQTFVRRTDKTVVEPASLRRIIEQARRRGYAVSNEEIEIGLRAVAVPVHSPQGSIIAALAVSASSARMSMTAMERDIVPALQRAAATLGGGPPPVPAPPPEAQPIAQASRTAKRNTREPNP